MKIINVGEVAVEQVIDFILLKENLQKLTRDNSVLCFVLAHQITVPNFYKALIDNSETIDATTRKFINFIVFYGNNAAIVEKKNTRYYRRDESYKINGLSTSNGNSHIYLKDGISFDECLSHFVKYETENVNVRYLSNHMTRGAMALMNRYSIDESRIPSLLFINPKNINDVFIATIDSLNAISHLYDKILKPLSICFHEIEKFHSNTSELGNLIRKLKESKNVIETSPTEIEKLEKELSVLTEKLHNNAENEKATIKLLEKTKQEYLNIKNFITIDNFNLFSEGLSFSITQKLKEVQKLLKEKEDFDIGKFIFKSTGHEKLLREVNNKRLFKSKNNFKSYINQILKDLDEEINRIRNIIATDEYRALKSEINRTKSRYNSANQFISEFKSANLGLLKKISKQSDKLISLGLREFITENSQDTFQIIRHILVSTSITKDMEKINKRDVFICHSSEDKNPYVTELYESLELNGIKCWFDKNEIKWGDSIASKVNEGLRVSNYVLVVLSRNSINKNWPKAELEASLNLEFSTGNTRVLPLLLGNELEIKEIIEYYPILSSKLFVKYSNGMDKIIELIKDRLS